MNGDGRAGASAPPTRPLSVSPREPESIEAVDPDESPLNDGEAPVGIRDNADGVKPLPLVRGVTTNRVTTKNTPLVLASATGSAITVSYADGRPYPTVITLVASHGTLSLAGTSGLLFIEGEPFRSTSMTFLGQADDISAALDGLTFVPAADYAGDAGACLEVSPAPRRMDVPSLCGDRVEAERSDAQEGPRAAVSIRIAVTPVNEPPTIPVVPRR